jgi:GNAT superfamily N-acetyltransferase
VTERVDIRPFEDDDWPEFLPILQEVARAGETYAMPHDITEADAREFWTGDHVVTARQGGTLLGSAKMGANRPAQGAHVGTASFMVGAAARGKGAGRALAEYVVDWHHRAGYRAIQFNAVVETNRSAVHLWQQLGFRIIGTVPAAFDSATHGLVGLHVMHLPLD